MIRFTWLAVAMAGFFLTFAGCGNDDTAGTEASEASDSADVSDDLEKAGVSEEDYMKAMKSGK